MYVLYVHILCTLYGRLDAAARMYVCMGGIRLGYGSIG